MSREETDDLGQIMQRVVKSEPEGDESGGSNNAPKVTYIEKEVTSMFKVVWDPHGKIFRVEENMLKENESEAFVKSLQDRE